MNEQYVALRDVKMCGCPADFVHGLALPRVAVRGVEDPARPDGIWQFAWDTAIKHMEPDSIALLVNPARQRGQDQLHVHLLKLKSGARQRMADNIAGTTGSLDEVWRIAARSAAARTFDDYGVVVIREANGEFTVVITPDSPEHVFTDWSCK